MLINFVIVQTYPPLPTCYDINCQTININKLNISDLIIIKKNKILNA